MSEADGPVFAGDFPDLIVRHRDELLVGSGINIDVAMERGYRSVMSKKQLEEAGFGSAQRRPPGFLLPVWTVEGKQDGFAYKPDIARKIENRDGRTETVREIKYEHPRGGHVRLDVHPRMVPILRDPTAEIWITEGQKKGDALLSAGLNAIVLHGVWGWRGTNDVGGKALLSDFDHIAFNGRRVNLAYDNDVMANVQVQMALDRLTQILQNRDAEVWWCRMPWLPGQPKVGVDDFLLTHSVDELREYCRPADAVEPDAMFFERDGCLYRRSTDNSGNPREERLSNFVMVIAQDVAIADGEETERTYTIRMRHVGGDLVTTKISALEWNDPRAAQKLLLAAAGPKFIVEQGRFPSLLIAAQKVSEGKTEVRKYYSHTGWAEVAADDWRFLTPSMAVGAHGFDPNIYTEVSGPGVDMYGVGWPKSEDDKVAAWDALDAAVRAASPAISLPLLAHIALAPIQSMMPIDKPSLLHLTGETGSFKTTYSTLLLNVFGNFDRERPPLSWTSTVNALERSAFTLKDLPVLVDDFKLAHVRRNEDIVRFIQNYADRTGRSRMKSDLSLRRTFVARGLLLSTGEDVPDGESSVLARMFVLDIQDGMIDRSLLTAAQGKAKTMCMIGGQYLAWLIRNRAAVKRRCEEDFPGLRDTYGNALPGMTQPRIAVACAQYEIAFDVFTDFLFEAYPQHQATIDGWAEKLRSMLFGAGQRQGERVQAQKASVAFMEWLTAAIASDQVKINPLNSRDARWLGGMMAPVVGWYSYGDGIYVSAERIWDAYKRAMRQAGDELHWTRNAVWRQLMVAGDIVKSSDGRTTTVRRIDGVPVRCLVFSQQSLGAIDEMERTAKGAGV